jgi:hypothetical protein
MNLKQILVRNLVAVGSESGRLIFTRVRPDAEVNDNLHGMATFTANGYEN